MALIFLGVSAAAIGAWGLFRLVQAFVTGRARGVWLSAKRASEPARLWLNVAVLVLLVAVSSTYMALTKVADGVVGSAFRARHSVAVDRHMPESPVARPSAAGCETRAPCVFRARWRRPGHSRRQSRPLLFHPPQITGWDPRADRVDAISRLIKGNPARQASLPVCLGIRRLQSIAVGFFNNVTIQPMKVATKTG